MSLRFRSAFVVVAATAAWLALPGVALAADACDSPTKTFVDGPGITNAWSDPANWVPSGLPSAGDQVCVPIASSIDVTVSPAAITFQSGAHVLTVSSFGSTPSIVVRSGALVDQFSTLYVADGQNITNAGTWNATSGLTVASSSPGTFTNGLTGTFNALTAGAFTFATPFVNAGTFNFSPSSGDALANLARGGSNAHSGRFDVAGAATGARLQFTGNHDLNGATLHATNPAAAYEMAGTITYVNVVKNVPLTFSAGTHTLGATPFAGASTNKILTYSGGTLAGDFTIPSGWTFNQNVMLYVADTQDITNQGTWNAAATTTVASSAPGVFTNAASGVFNANTVSTFGFAAPFVNAGSFTYAPTTDGSTATLSNGGGAHSGSFDVKGSTTGSSIRFTGAHTLSGATLQATNATAAYDMAGTLSYTNVVKNVPLTFSAGTHTLGATPFAGASTNKILTYSGGTLAGDFTIPSGWTFNQDVMYYVADGQDITNEGIWNAATTITVASSSPGVFTNAASGVFNANTVSTFGFAAPFVNAGSFTYAPTTDGSTANLSLGGGAAHSGTFNIGGAAPGTKVSFSGTQDLAGATLDRTNPNGSYVSSASISGASLTVNAPLRLTGGALTAADVTVNGAGTVEFQAATLSGIGSITGSDALTFQPIGSVDLGARNLVVRGTLLLDAASNTTVLGTGSIDASDGRIIRSGAATYSVIPNVTTDANTVVDAAGGTLSLRRVNTYGDQYGPGTWTISNGSAVRLGDDGTPASITGTVILEDPGSTLSSASSMSNVSGSLAVRDGASITLPMSAAIHTGGVVEAAVGGTVVADDIDIRDGGTLRGAGTVDLTGEATIDGLLDRTVGDGTIESMSVGGTFAVGARQQVLSGQLSLGNWAVLALDATPAGSGHITAAGMNLGGMLQVNAAALGATPTYDYKQEFVSAAGGVDVTDRYEFDVVGSTLAAPRVLEDVLTDTAISVEVNEHTAPSAPGAATSVSPEVNVSTVTDAITVTWPAATDLGSGVQGYRVVLGGTVITDATPVQVATTKTFTGVPTGSHTVVVQTVDNEGNLSVTNAIYGPFLLAATPVVVPPTDPVPTNPVPPVVVPPVVVPPTPTPDTTPPKVGVVPAPAVSPTGIVTLKVPACPKTEASCRGTVKLESKVAPSLLRAKLVNFVLGNAKFTAKGGQTAIVKVKLSPKAKKLLKKAKVLKVITTITVIDAAGNKAVVKRTLTIRAPRTLR